MALFKYHRGNRTDLDSVALHDGHAYFCIDDGTFHIDYLDDNGILKRKQINADEANSIVGFSIVDAIAEDATAIPTAKAVYDLISGKQDTITGTEGQIVGFDADGNAVAQDVVQSDWNQNDPTALDYVQGRTHWEEENIILNVVATDTSTVALSENISLEIGKTYTVYINGVSEEVVCGEEWGSGYRILNTSNGTIYEFSYCGFDVDDHVVVVDGKTVHPLDSKYLPDEVVTETEFNTALSAKADVALIDALETVVESKSDEGHTHSYAGSSSAGGAATSANKLNTDAGSVTQPVYFKNGIPVETTHTLEASVPSDAKFTDTTYSEATTSVAGLMGVGDKAKLDGIEEGANAYSLPTASSSTLGGVKTTSTVTSTTGLTACPIISGVPYYKDTDTTNYLPLSGGTVTGVTSFTDTTASTSTTTGAVKISGGLGVAGSIYGSVVYGAVWNDYAEFRETTEYIEAGRVVIENGDDTLSICTERLQSGANIVSDTYGFAIGETDVCKTPLAVSGRVLAYTYEDRYSFAPGDAVCAAPGGTVSKMTREEIMTYPERILGTVSAIPEYETWGAGNVAVNGRIWIKVK